jgi:hypothetical protein
MTGAIIMASRSLPTVDEIVNSLKRSFIPTILIEGPDDVFVYRWLKRNLNINPVSLQACGGRNSLFSIYDRRNEFSDKNVIFVADKDSYRFEEVPEDRNGVIFTSGYCIENDIYEGSNIGEFIDDEDRARLSLLRDIIGKWFAFELNKYLSSPHGEASLSVAAHINVISPIGLDRLCNNFAEQINFIAPSANELGLVTNDYNLNVRGKQLFQMLSRFLSTKGRFSNFSEKNLVEIALKQGNNPLMDRLVTDINNELTGA